MIESKIVRSGDRFVIEIEGKRIAPIAYMSYQPDVADYARHGCRSSPQSGK